MSISPRELVAGAIEIASLPEIFLKINEMIDSPHHSAADIGRVISNDTALSARLLKIANSVFYGFPSQIDTISRAITVIGTRELRELILATSVTRCFKGLPNDLITMEEFWRHSICCALASRSLAAHRGEQLVERFFVAGLLHDIGSLLVYRKLPELAREALLRAQHNNVPLYQAEQEVMGFDHAMVGAEILRKWKLPEHFQEATEFHHSPQRAQRFPSDTALVHIADVISDALQYGNSGDPHVPPMDPQAWQLAGLNDDVVSPVIADVEHQFNSVFELFHPEPQGVAANLH